MALNSSACAYDLTRVHCQFLLFCVLYFFVIGLVGLCCKPQPLVIIIIIIIMCF